MALFVMRAGAKPLHDVDRPVGKHIHLDSQPARAIAASDCITCPNQIQSPQWSPVAVADDPLVRMPGTQPDQGVQLDGPGQCLNCHADYDPLTEPVNNWQGSVMAQAGRDFLYWATMTVAGQDAIWAIGNPNATDICLRCHMPGGWLGGRSDPTNGSLMTGIDFDGVQCNLCHYLYDPFYETTFDGSREGDDWSGYWDETDASDTPSSEAALVTYNQDRDLAAVVSLFNGQPFFNNDLPPLNYTENGGGQMFVSTLMDNRRASFADANANHNLYYSRYHKSKFFCATCHDISNPVLHNLGADPTQPLPTETDQVYSYFHVERTFSEFLLSSFGQQGGATGAGPFAPDVFVTSQPGNAIASCQDCHMRDQVGKGCDKTRGVQRPDGSIEHPQSGVPQHDLTGGNMWVSYVLASSISGNANYDATNSTLLNQGAALLTLDLSAGDVFDGPALLAGVDRAEQMLGDAAAIEEVSYDETGGELSFRIQNYTGHKLISGYPEGRRMFVNIQFYEDDDLLFEVNPYDGLAGTLKGLPGAIYDDPDGILPAPVALSAAEQYVDELVYEMHGSSSLTGEAETFHFVLSDDRYKDNRIPPKGFRIDEAADRLSGPVWHGDSDLDYFSAAEYAGGFDQVSLADYGLLVPNADRLEITLYYQTTSREYIEFLRNEINGSGELTLSGLGAEGDPAYIIQTDPFFDQLRAWGDTIWQLWRHNKDVPGAAPVAMTQADYQAHGNHPPLAQSDAYTTNEDSPLTVMAPGVLENDTDEDDDELTAVLDDGPNHGLLVLQSDGRFVYTPTLNFNGSDGFSYHADDGSAPSASVGVTLTVTAENDPPIAASDAYTTTRNTPLVVIAPGVLDNDQDVDGDSLTAALNTGPVNGILKLALNGAFVYTPTAGFAGQDTFTYMADDGVIHSAQATVTITVVATNSPPLANSDSYTTTEDTPLIIPIPGVLANDQDPDGNPLAAVLDSLPNQGFLDLEPDGSFVYTPSLNYNGPDYFSYHAYDGLAPSDTVVVTLTVTAENDPPVAIGDIFTTTAGSTLDVPAPGVLVNDGDVEGGSLTAILNTPPVKGTLALRLDGSFVYTPTAGFSGLDTFSYQAYDGASVSQPVTVQLVVEPQALDLVYLPLILRP